LVVGYVGENETVIPFDLGVRMAGGSGVCPILLQDERKAFLIFSLDSRDPSWDGSWVRVVSPGDSEIRPIGVIQWIGCHVAVFGHPYVDIRMNHRLWTRGLKECVSTHAGEVQNSSWIASLEQQDRDRVYYEYQRYSELRHFILLFWDSTFECLARDYTVEIVQESMLNVIDRIVREHL